MPEGLAGGAMGFEPATFQARWPWFGGDLQTLRNTLHRRMGTFADLSHWPVERVELPMADGTGDVLLAALNRPDSATDRPLAVLVHGLTGCEDSGYMRASAHCLLTAGYPVLRLNLRGAGPSRSLCMQEYHAGRSEDLRMAFTGLPTDLTVNGVVAAGYSLGGNMLLKFLGEQELGAPIRAAASVSAPIDLRAAQQRIMMPRNRLYHHYMLARMKVECTEGREGVSEAQRRDALMADSVYAFDHAFVARRNGFGTADNYYQINSAEQYLPAIEIPTLIIHAHNDPWIPIETYLRHDWARNRNIVPLLPPGGGHVGFHGRGGPPTWHDQCLLDFFTAKAG